MDAALATQGEQYNVSYPRHNINPAEKTLEWGILYAKAMWYDWQYSVPRTIFYNKADKYEELRLYAQGKQPINKYKKLLGVDEQTNLTYLNIDWSVRPIVAKYRDIAISRLIQKEYGIIATPVDELAKGELDSFYAKIKARIAVRALMQQSNPELANHPAILPEPGEPLDQEELDMRMEFGEQFNRSKDAELAIQLAYYQNNVREMRRAWFECFFDCGVAGYYEWLYEGKPCARIINPEAVITNYCRFPDFRDLVQAGEVVDVALVDLAAMTDESGNRLFTDEQLTDLAENVAGKWSNTSLLGRSTNYFKGYDKFKVKVLDCEFFSYNDYYYNDFVRPNGNVAWERKYRSQSEQGKRKYKGKRIKVVYQIKWIVGTDYGYDFRLKKDQKRSNDYKKKAETTLSYRFYAPNFYEMRSLSMMERLMPFADDYQMTCYKIQNLKARLVPNGWWIDLDALENVALDKGGENMTPKQLLDMFLETGILVGRSRDIMGDNVNYKPIIPLQNSIVTELVGLYQDLMQTLQQMESIIGFNDITAGATPNPKTLVPGYENANESTNNALYPLQFGEETLNQALANDMLIRTQQALRKGDVQGFAPALGTNTMRFIKLDATIAGRDYGLMLEEKTTEEQKQFLITNMQQDLANGFLDLSDAMMIANTYNIKQAQMLLAYKVKKNKELQQQNETAKIQMTLQGQQQSAQQTAQLAAQAVQLEYSLKMQLDNQNKQWDYKIAQLKVEGQAQATEQTNQVKLATHSMSEVNKANMQKREKGLGEDEINEQMTGEPAMPQEQNAPEDEMV